MGMLVRHATGLWRSNAESREKFEALTKAFAEVMRSLVLLLLVVVLLVIGVT